MRDHVRRAGIAVGLGLAWGVAGSGAPPALAGDTGETDPVKAGLMQGYPLPPEKQVTLRNWLEFPFNRWAFRNTQALFPTSPVPRAGDVIAFEEGPELDIDRLEFFGADGRHGTGREYFAREHVDGFIVLHKGKVIFERYFDSMNPDGPHLWQSMTTSLTGLLAEMLIQDGMLDAGKTAGDYVPEIKDTVWGRATLRHLLDMAVAVQEPAAATPLLPGSPACFLKSLQAPGPVQGGANGDIFHYSDSPPQVIGLVLTKVTGKSWSRLVHERIWSHLGAERDGYVSLDVDGQAAAAGGFNATLRDTARFAEMIRLEGLWNGRRVVSKDVIRVLHKNAWNSRQTAQGNVAMMKVRSGMAYRDYWYQVNDSRGSIEALGLFGQHMHVNPADQITIVQFGSFTGPEPNPLDWAGLVEAITKQLTKIKMKGR